MEDAVALDCGRSSGQFDDGGAQDPHLAPDGAWARPQQKFAVPLHQPTVSAAASTPSDQTGLSQKMEVLDKVASSSCSHRLSQ